MADTALTKELKADMDTRSGRLEIINVSKSYGAGPLRRQVIRQCSMSIERNKPNVSIGPSGCGKSTLLRLISGFEKADEGSIVIDGKPVRGPGPDRLMVFQESALFDWMTTTENILFGPSAR